MPISTLGDRRGLIRTEQGPQTWLGVIATGATTSSSVVIDPSNDLGTIDPSTNAQDIDPSVPE